ncbi:MAG: hypothetical protein RL654_1027 [Pseudomonadota bacterium]|jgi:uncharacterized protein YaaW (UPF0174 family)
MAYRYDPDLEFLSKIRSTDLDDLVRCLTHDKDRSARLTEELTANSQYKAHYPNHSKYWELIAAEIQCFGGNTLANALRGGKGVPYKEVLTEVCDKLGVNYSKHSSVDTIEQNMLMKILQDSLDKMSPQELRELCNSVGIPSIGSPSRTAVIAGCQALFKAGGFKSYQLTVVIVNAVLKALIGRGLSFAGGQVLTKAASVLTGPIGWAITGIWTALDIASAAYRVTIPAVIQVAALRQKHAHDLECLRSQPDIANPGKLIIRCPACDQKLRIPAGKQQLDITCTSCRANWIWSNATA